MHYLPVYIKIQLVLIHACSRGKKIRNMYLSFKVEVLYPQVHEFLQILLTRVTKGLQ